MVDFYIPFKALENVNRQGLWLGPRFALQYNLVLRPILWGTLRAHQRSFGWFQNSFKCRGFGRDSRRHCKFVG